MTIIAKAIPYCGELIDPKDLSDETVMKVLTMAGWTVTPKKEGENEVVTSMTPAEVDKVSQPKVTLREKLDRAKVTK